VESFDALTLARVQSAFTVSAHIIVPAFRVAPAALLLIGAVSLWTPFLNSVYAQRWFAWPQVLLVGIVPLAVLGAGYLLLRGLTERREVTPFLASLLLFVLCFVGLGNSFFPHLVPNSVTIREAAAPDNSLSFLLVGGVVLIPIILAYTAYAYWVFRGKVNAARGITDVQPPGHTPPRRQARLVRRPLGGERGRPRHCRLPAALGAGQLQ
jgi:cytochrome d ubiquinol oxidase subunit II